MKITKKKQRKDEEIKRAEMKTVEGRGMKLRTVKVDKSFKFNRHRKSRERTRDQTVYKKRINFLNQSK